MASTVVNTLTMDIPYTNPLQNIQIIPLSRCKNILPGFTQNSLSQCQHHLKWQPQRHTLHPLPLEISALSKSAHTSVTKHTTNKQPG